MRHIGTVTRTHLMLRRIASDGYEYVRNDNVTWPVYWTQDPRVAKVFKSEQHLKAYTTAIIKSIIKAESVQSNPNPTPPRSYRDYKYRRGDLDPLARAEVTTTTYTVTVNASDVLMNVDMNELYKKPLFAKKMGGAYSRPQKKLMQKV